MSFGSSNVGNFFCSWVLKTRNEALSGCSRATTAQKCTKKRDARAELLFCLSKPIAFLPFSLPSPSSLLKLHSNNGRDHVQWKRQWHTVTNDNDNDSDSDNNGENDYCSERTFSFKWIRRPQINYSSFYQSPCCVKFKLQTVLSGKLLKRKCTGYELCSLNLLGSLCTW